MKFTIYLFLFSSWLAIGSTALAVPPAGEQPTTTGTQPVTSLADPTLPSAKIKQRLRVPSSSNHVPSAAVRTEVSPMPTMILKAIVLTDRDHGSALIEHAGRKFVVPLARGSALPLDGFSVDGVPMTVEDFSNSSLLIRSGTQSWLLR